MFESIKRLFSRAHPEPAVPEPVGETVLFNVYCTRTEIPQPRFPHILRGHRDLSDPALLEHLNGFCHFVLAKGDGTMTADKYHVILHLQRVQHHVTLRVGEGDTAALYAWAKEANAVLFREDGQLLDPDGKVLVDAVDGKADPQACLPHPEKAWQRKAATEAALAERGIQVIETLPPLISEEELVLRDRDEVIGRARALLLVALRAESVASEQPMTVQMLLSKMPLAAEELSPSEQAFLDKEGPTREECAQFIWRYESLYVLAWALGLVKELPFPEKACEPAPLVATVIELKDPAMRPASEILDALDQTYRLHWHIRQQRLKKKGEAKGVDVDVVMQRHHALNWLVRFQHAAWDEVDTPT
jgi:hypothetical protein